MKKRIKGLLYDTNSANEIDWDCNNYAATETKYIKETLYRKKTGEYFLYIEGNSKTPYAKKVGNVHAPGAIIKPLSVDQAKAWGLQHMLEADFEKEFSFDEKYDYTKAQKLLSLSRTAIKRLEALAQQQNTSQSQIVENLINAEYE